MDGLCAGRYRSRLAALLEQQPTALLDIAAVACEESAAARKKSDELLAVYTPTPAVLVSKVLLSPELLGMVSANFRTRDRRPDLSGRGPDRRDRWRCSGLQSARRASRARARRGA